MYRGLHVTYQLLLSDFNKTWIWTTDFSKNIQISNFKKSALWEPSCSAQTNRQTIRQTDLTKLTFFSHNFANAPKNDVLHYWTLWNT